MTRAIVWFTALLVAVGGGFLGHAFASWLEAKPAVLIIVAAIGAVIGALIGFRVGYIVAELLER